MWAVVPVKAFLQSKQRLASFLNAQQRQALSQAMLLDVLHALESSSIVENTILVSNEENLPQDISNAYILNEADDVDGLNSAFEQGIAYVAKQCSDTGNKESAKILLIHADLPLLTATALDNQLQSLKACDVGIFSDAEGLGTNGLAFSLHKRPQLFFGENSQALHIKHFKKQQLSYRVLSDNSTAFDVDDLLAFMRLNQNASGLGCYTQQVLGQLPDLPLFDAESVLQDFIATKTYQLPNKAQALALANSEQDLRELAYQLCESHFHNRVSYSRKVFLPLTHLCRDVCHYCTFAKTPKFIEQAYMSKDEVLASAKVAQNQGCKEALLTLGEKPELRYSVAADALAEMGFASTLEYVADMAQTIFEETGLLPHINAGCMNDEEIIMLKKCSASMGLMLESVSKRLCTKGMPHYGSPDKDPALRLATIERAGKHQVPFTTGILIGIGETRQERIESLLAIRDLHEKYGHIQEIIIQNFKAKPDTKMAQAPEPDLNDLLWTIAVARIIFGPTMSIQVPPNLSPGVLPALISAGINDWGGVSPVTPDFVNPEAPWPHLTELAQQSKVCGKVLLQRLTIYPEYIAQREQYLAQQFYAPILSLIDTQGFVKEGTWLSGVSNAVDDEIAVALESFNEQNVSSDILQILLKAEKTELLSEADICRLFTARGDDFAKIMQAADQLRKQQSGDGVSFAINRNINYTNICYFKCKFCAFSKGKLSENLRGKPYDLSEQEVKRRVIEAAEHGATEVCMQGGINPNYTGQTYIDLCHMVKSADSNMHVHAFSPLEIWHGAATLGLSLEEYLTQLKHAGLGTLPGTAAEILSDDVRAQLCGDKINTAQWLEVMRVAHKVGLRSTATIMFGHIESYGHWAKHLLAVRDLQRETGGFTEFVPLPFVASEAPIYLKGQSRQGPSLREALLMHAVARLTLGAWFINIQASWVKLGDEVIKLALQGGANDLGGTLINESITRAAGAEHGQHRTAQDFKRLANSIDRPIMLRNTLYQKLDSAVLEKLGDSQEIAAITLDDYRPSSNKKPLVKPGETLNPCDVQIV